MIIKRLVITNLYDNTQKAYDIQAVLDNISSLQCQDSEEFKDALTAALFGRDEALAPMVSGNASEVNFTLNGAEYMLSRTFRDNGDTAQLSHEGEDGTVCSAIEEVDAFLRQNLRLSKYAFKKLLEADTASAQASFFKCDKVRGEYIRSLFTNLVGNLDSLYEEKNVLEKKLYEAGIKYDAMPKYSTQEAHALAKEITDLDNLIQSQKEELDRARDEIALAKEYFAVQEKLESLTEEQKEIASREAQTEKLEERLDGSNEALMLSGLFKRNLELGAEITDTEREIKRLEKEIGVLRGKIDKGEKAVKAAEKEYTLLEERGVQLNKVMQDIILEGSADPLSLKIEDKVEEYYHEFNEELKVLSQKKEEVDKLYNRICTECSILEERKKEIILPARVKKAIAEGSLFEEFITNQTALLADKETELEQLKRNLAQANEELAGKAAAIEALKGEIEEQINKIKGSFPSVEEAINDAVIQKQTLYANHILIASHEDEVAAIDTKIQRLEVDKGEYAGKIKLLKEAVEDLEEHKAKCAEKKEEFVQRKVGVLGENKFADIINDIEMGDSCPVCGNFITEKKLGNKLDYSAIDAEITAFDKLIKEDEAKLLEVLNTLGKYETALRVNGQYMASLQETKQAKIAAVTGILKEAGVANAAEMEKVLRASIEKSNRLRFDNEKLTALKEKLEIMTRFLEKEQEAAKNLQKISIKEKEKEIADFKKTLERAKKEYGKFYEDLKGEKASSLLPKLNIVEKELETIEKELGEKQARKAEVFAEKQELEKAIDLLSAKAVLVDIKGANYGYKEIVSKIISDKLSEIVLKIRQNDTKKEDAKVKVAALHKLVKKQNMELNELHTQLDIQKTKNEALAKTLAGLKQNYEERFAALGITSISDLNRLILPREEAIQYDIAIKDYYEERARNAQSVADAQARMQELSEYFLAYENNLEKEDALEKAIEKNIFALASLAGARQTVIETMEKTAKLERERDALAKEFEELDTLLAAIPSDSERAGESLARYIVKLAAKLMWQYTQGGYTLSYKDEKIGLVNLAKDKEVKTSGYTEQEKKVMAFTAASAVKYTFEKLTRAKVSLPTLITLQENEAGALLSKALAVYAQDKQLIINQPNLAIIKPLTKFAAR